ncbi:MAG: hypothetical protein C5B59_14715 [Bacteroidetes bacterium]|nr:MAG: hypothetical protein C5B59_14715 [Bacteroidota bacterium]
MEKKDKKHIKLLLILTAIFVIGLFVWTRHKYKLAEKKIPEVVAKKSNGLYKIDYDDINIDEVGGNLHVKNIRLSVDSVVYNELKAKGKAPPVILNLLIPLLQITGIKTPKALLNKEIEGKKILIDSPSIEIWLRQFMQDTTGYSPDKDIYSQILGQFKNIKIDSLIVTRGSLSVRNQSGKLSFRGDNVSLILSDLLMDSLHRSDESRILFSKNLDLLCNQIVLHSKDRKYQFLFDHLEFISQINRFNIGSVRIIPQLSEQEFAESFKYQKDRYHFIFDNVSLRNIKREALWRKQIEADSLIIGQSSFRIYRDISRPHDSISRVGKYPQQLMTDLPLPLHISIILFPHSFIEYKEKNGKSDSSGKVQFTNVSASIKNATNMHSEIAVNNICRLDFRAKFLDESPVKARLDMYLRDKKGRFSIEGVLDSMHGVELNKLIEPMALARIDKGQIDHLNFHLNGTDSQANGKLLFLYHDLQIALLKKTDEKQLKKKGLPSLAANIMIKNSNPPDVSGSGKHHSNDPARWANVHYDRDIHRSLFHLIWKSIFTGVKQTVGMK